MSSAEPKYRRPDAKTLDQVVKLAIAEDKPIMLDYWEVSLNKTAFIGVQKEVIDGETIDEKILAKNEDEYTSEIAVTYRVGNDFIVKTANSLYLVDAQIPVKKIMKSKTD
jgi:hypothetical protein